MVKNVDSEYVSTKEARELLGVSIDTLRNWDKQGKINTIRTPSGYRKYSKQDIYDILGWSVPALEKRKIAYCRVSSKHQKADLVRQENYFRANFPDYEVVSDIGSGINWKRKGLETILDCAISGTIETVVVAHRDRLSRFAFELLEKIIEKGGGELVVLEDNQKKSSNEELADDLLSIIHMYSSRANGKRRYNTTSKTTRTQDQNKKDQDIPERESEKDPETVDGSE